MANMRHRLEFLLDVQNRKAIIDLQAVETQAKQTGKVLYNAMSGDSTKVQAQKTTETIKHTKKRFNVENGAANNLRKTKIKHDREDKRRNADSLASVKKNAGKKVDIVEDTAKKTTKIKNKQASDDITRDNAQVKRAEESSKKIKNALQIGFSMHIIRMFALPLVSAFRGEVVRLLDKFGEFDKAFVDYAAKSEEFGSWLSKTDFAKIAEGQTFAMLDAAEAAERFAASGVDVSQNVDALTDVLQVATIADVDYDTAANSVIRTMNAFHMSIGQSAKITDAMVNAANASTAELSDMTKWFEFAAAGAYGAGLEVEQFAAYLGILSSTGMPNTGAAIRQLFLQFGKEDVRQRFRESFGLTDEDFGDFNKLISHLKNIVSESETQAETTRQITTLLGGKVTSQQALNNLLKAEPELWNQVMGAVDKAGSTQDLYAKMTDNVADALQRVRNALDMIQTQMGSIFIPILKIAEFAIINLGKVLNRIPDWIKGLVGGGFILLVAAVSTVMLTLAGLVGTLFILRSSVEMLRENVDVGTLSWRAYSLELRHLSSELLKTLPLMNATAASQKKLAYSNTITIGSFKYQATAMKASMAAMQALSGIMVGYMVTQGYIEKGMFSEARVVSMLTSVWMAYQGAKMGALLGPGGALLGAAALGGGTYAVMDEQIRNAEIQARVARREQITGIGGGGTTVVDASTKYFVDNAEFSSDGSELIMDNLEQGTNSLSYL